MLWTMVGHLLVSLASTYIVNVLPSNLIQTTVRTYNTLPYIHCRVQTLVMYYQERGEEEEEEKKEKKKKIKRRKKKKGKKKKREEERERKKEKYKVLLVLVQRPF